MMANDSEDDASHTIDCVELGVAYPRMVVVHVKNPVSSLSIKESLKTVNTGSIYCWLSLLGSYYRPVEGVQELGMITDRNFPG